MAEKRARRGGKKNRKFGRWSRAPAMRRYVGENRWERNKLARIARHKRRMARKAAKRRRRGMTKDDAQKRIRAAARAGNVRICPSDGVDAFPRIWVEDFLSNVLGVYGAWISDESSLTDFGTRAKLARDRIIEDYGVDVGDTTNLLAIFRMIHSTNVTVQ